MSGTRDNDPPDSTVPEGADQEEPTGTPTSHRHESETSHSENERKPASEKHRYAP
jgi:hypothetical protein